ncbi:sulfite exporter TauE/SafE family protein [Mucilaginibacter ximonensis]|uniref:Probable membrane transporter protein n=1 Tax=Mucilaginibacter ximonensis TaxID=538021 RepID=A0ABW5Y889_9SPHI
MILTANVAGIMAIVFSATVFRSAFGFGESLIAVPLLALLMPLNIAVPLSVLISVTIAAFVVVQDHKKIHFKSAANLIIYAFIGIPIGLWLLTHVPELGVKLGLGVLIVSFAIYLLSGTKLTELTHDNRWWLFSCGLLSGILGGAYGINGPPLVIYGAKRRWSAQHFRATLQAYFLVASAVGVLGYWVNGLLSQLLFNYYLWSLPAVVPAVIVGRIVNSRLHSDKFFKYSYIILVLLGALLIVSALTTG